MRENTRSFTLLPIFLLQKLCQVYLGLEQGPVHAGEEGDPALRVGVLLVAALYQVGLRNEGGTKMRENNDYYCVFCTCNSRRKVLKNRKPLLRIGHWLIHLIVFFGVVG